MRRDERDESRRPTRRRRERFVTPKEIEIDIMRRNFSEQLRTDELEVRQSDGQMKQSENGLSIISDRFTSSQSKPGGGVFYAPPPPGFDRLRGVFIGYIPVVMEQPNSSSMSSSSSMSAPVSSRFQFSGRQSKFLFLYKNRFELGRNEIVFNATVRTKQLFKQGSEIPREYKGRVNNIYSDYRLCSSGPIVFDSETGLEFAMLITDQCIYALYSIGTVLHDPTMGSAQFCCVKEVWRRVGTDEEPVMVGIGLDQVNNRVRYYVDDIMVFEIVKLGRRLSHSTITVDNGEIASIVVPQEVRFGYGHFTFLDHQWPDSNLVHVDKLTDPNSVIYRSESGLCAISAPHTYKEILPDMLGRHLPIVPKHSFGAGDDQSIKFQFFDQGVISFISEMSAVEKQILYERIRDDNIIDDITLE